MFVIHGLKRVRVPYALQLRQSAPKNRLALLLGDKDATTPKQVYKLLRHNSRKGRNIATTSNKPINIFNIVYMFLLVGMLFILAFPAKGMTKLKLSLVLFQIGLMFQMV